MIKRDRLSKVITGFLIGAMITGLSNTASFAAEESVDDIPAPYIIDMDFEADCDDVAALRIATAAARDGDIKLVGVMSSVETEDDVNLKAIHGVLCYDEMPDVPIGKGEHSEKTGHSTYWEELAKYSDGSHYHAEDALELYKRLLTESPDKVTIITTGYLTNVARLIDDSPDLVKQKVKHIYIVGAGLEGGWEQNIFMTKEAEEATKTVVSKAIKLVQITFIPVEVGGPLKVGGLVTKNVPDDVVSRAMTLFETPDGREAWDPTGTWAAIYGEKATRTKRYAAYVSINNDDDGKVWLYVTKDLSDRKQNCWMLERTSDSLEWYENKLDKILLFGSPGFARSHIQK